ncbi:uncharacterized protein LOC128233717 isoform X2 [Mya arenaria]|uniref:uncharacterized protein LOC128233717 isoform X2 n=1 Tax=Mya arenaria TaxID=6604 RepID=UPI0022E3A188|nr:uncharacterized protein LOC128233717 isoform X2 [Mya arenaria]
MDVKFNQNKCFAFLVILSSFVTGEYYFLSNDATVWGESGCTLAFPNLTFTDEGINVTNDGMSSLILPTEGVWIGLYKARLSFAYVGCNQINDTDVLLVRDLSDCRWQSGCDTFGVREWDTAKVECTCFTGSVTKDTGCTSMCGSRDTYPCGSQGHNIFSIYTVENVSNCSAGCSNMIRGCLGFNFNHDNKVRWKLCDRFRNSTPILCSNQSYTESDGQVQVLLDINMTWANTGQTCFESNLFPTPFRHIQSTRLNKNRTVWTSVIRKESILRDDDNFITSDPKLFVYVTFAEGQLVVRLDGNSTAERKSLCLETKNTATTTIPQTTKESAPPESTSKWSTPTMQTSNENIPTPKGNQHDPVTEVLAGVSSFLLLVVVVAVLYFLKRRGKLRCFESKSRIDNNGNASQQDITPVYMELDTKVKPKAFHNHAYSMQEQFLPITTVDPNEESMGDLQNHLEKSSNNVYNTVEGQIGDYDDIHLADVLQLNDYDSTFNCRENISEVTCNHLNTEMRRVPTAVEHDGKNVAVRGDDIVIGKPNDRLSPLPILII